MAGQGAEQESATRAEHELLARLDRAFAHQRQLDPAILASIRLWQRTDRTYEIVLRLARGEGSAAVDQSLDSRVAHRVKQHLDIATASGTVPFPLRVFRGMRNFKAGLGVADVASAPGHRALMRGFCATSVFRSVASREFTGRSGVLLDLLIPPGSRALWIAGLGDPALRRQGELLLPRDVQIDVYSHVGLGERAPVLIGGVVNDEQIH